MPTIHPPSDSPSFGLRPVAKPGRHRVRFNPKISFQIQFAIRIERIKFEFQLIRFQGIVPAGAARCVAPEIHAPARSGNCQPSWRDLAFRFRRRFAVRYTVMSIAPFTWVQKIARKKFCRQTLFDARIQSLEGLFK
ncbi:hypothetical protein L2Y90_16685 [Burkholderia pyrrocinia]|uniref:hypothetical protein n=1 Tax=Burkholderia pyrrocinia TaxID=60550 RepID=UPI00215A85A6|nr:hypothetical protein [Burkholderia pyrrocinia]UVE65447.1 hypothetical protein L2Y90_16685 [Burkholderia pyrrocinia]